MHIALQGALWGLLVGVALIAIEYIFVSKSVEGRTSPTNPRPKFEEMDRKRIRSVVSFSVFIPPAFALGAWLIWG
jgi:hypothetical protein